MFRKSTRLRTDTWIASESILWYNSIWYKSFIESLPNSKNYLDLLWTLKQPTSLFGGRNDFIRLIALTIMDGAFYYNDLNRAKLWTEPKEIDKRRRGQKKLSNLWIKCSFFTILSWSCSAWFWSSPIFVTVVSVSCSSTMRSSMLPKHLNIIWSRSSLSLISISTTCCTGG